MRNTRDGRISWCPGLVDFPALFAEQTRSAADLYPPGFPDGSCLLITGPPGAGKTTLALALVRDLMRGQPNARLLILSNEVSRDKLQSDFAEFGWFQDFDSVFTALRCRHESMADLPSADSKTRAGAVRIAEATAKVALNASPEVPMFVIVDSLTSLLKDCASAGQRRRLAHYLVSQLTSRSAGSSSPALMILLTEQPTESDFVSESAPPEEYVADFVFKLTRRDTGAGRRLRMLRITKSRGANMRIGDHTFAIVSKNSINDVVAQRMYRRRIMRSIGADLRCTRWGTVLIAARPKLDPIGEANARLMRRAAERESDLLSTGTPGLDAILSGGPGYVHRSAAGVERQPCLHRGSTTLLVGGSGSGKTILCLQFLLEQGQDLRSLQRAMYVNFENTPAHVREMFPNNEIARRLLGCNFLYRRRSNLDVNLWLAELCYAVRERQIERLVIDGLSDLLATIEEREYSRIVETLLVAVRRASLGRCTIVVTYEADHEAPEQFSRVEGLSVTADNVLIMQQLLINDELRKTIYVLKARRQKHDAQVREITIATTRDSVLPLTIGPGLENYRNVLSGKPEPLSVVLRLLAENTAEHEFNADIAARLQRIHGCTVRSLEFSRAEIASTLDNAVQSPDTTMAATDISLMSLDEWWIRDYAVRRRLGGQIEPTLGEHPLMPLDPPYQETTFPESDRWGRRRSEHWVFETEKATVAAHGASRAPLRVETLGAPNYLDFGIFCVTAKYSDGETAADAIAAVPRVWTAMQNGDFVPLAEQDETTIVGWLRRKLVDCGPAAHGFTFDLQTVTTAVCVFLEFAWGFGAEEDFLARNALEWVGGTGDDRKFLAQLPATRGLRFLQYLVKNGLMPYRCRVKDSRQAILSRVWYSSLRELHDSPQAEPLLFPVPCFPTGVATAQAGLKEPLACALDDIGVRFARILGRVSAAARYRNDQELILEVEAMERYLARVCEMAPSPEATTAFRTLGERLHTAVLRSRCFISGASCAPTENEAVPPLFMAAARYIDVQDVRQLLDWHNFRLSMVQAELERSSLTSIIYGIGNSPQADINALAGFACSGSWLLGSLRTCHSPKLALKMIDEITSFDSAVTRSAAGAGIPARKDFYEYYGDEPATLVPHLTWKRLLDCAGALVRRRDRTVCSSVRFSDISAVIYRELVHCLTVAHDRPDQSDEAAILSIRTILADLVRLMREGFSVGHRSVSTRVRHTAE